MGGCEVTNAHRVGEPTRCGVSRSPTLATLVSRRIVVTGPTGRAPPFLGAIAPPPVRRRPGDGATSTEALSVACGRPRSWPVVPRLRGPGDSRLLMGLPWWRGGAVGAPSRRPPHLRSSAPPGGGADALPLSFEQPHHRHGRDGAPGPSPEPPISGGEAGECHRSPADEALVSRRCAVVTALTNARCAGEPTLRGHCRSPTPLARRPGDEGLGWCPPPLASMPGRAGQPSRRPLRPG